jgi:hypothetical protein
VAHEEHGLAPLSAGGPEEVQQSDRILRIQLSRGLIRKNERRVVRESDGDGNPLLFAAATHLIRLTVPFLAYSHRAEEIRRPLLAVLRAEPGESHGQLHIFPRRQQRHEIEELKDEPDSLETVGNEARLRQANDIRPIDRDGTGRRTI